MPDRQADGKPQVLFKGFEDAWSYAGDADGRFFFLTDKDAPLWRLMSVDVGHGAREAVEVIPEGKERLEAAGIVHQPVVVKRLKNASNRIFIHGLDGRALRADRAARPSDRSPASPARPTTTRCSSASRRSPIPSTPFRYEFTTGEASEFENGRPQVDAAAYEVKQVWYPSKDGTQVLDVPRAQEAACRGTGAARRCSTATAASTSA